MILSIESLVARRGSRLVLDDVSFRAHRGEILGVIGPNGAGKTTLFECIAGVLPFESGTIEKPPLFYVPDAIRPWPDQTLRWTLDLQRAMFASNARVPDELDLARLESQKVKSLSKGEAKRMNIALALLAPQELVLLDEPFDGLDLRQTRVAMDVLRRFIEDGHTLVLSIHQLTDAARICDRLLLIDGGRSIAEGTLDQLRAGAGVSGGGLEEVFLALT